MTLKLRNFNKHHLIEIVLVLIIIALLLQLVFSPFSFKTNKISAEKDSQGNLIDVQTKKPLALKELDFPSSDEGSLIAWTKESYFRQPVDKIVVLFVSARLPGLALIYYPEEKRLIGGTPQMAAEGISLFDGQPHQVGYIFKAKDKQQLIYDGRLVANSPFQLYSQSQLTGMFIGAVQPTVSESIYKIEIS